MGATLHISHNQTWQLKNSNRSSIISYRASKDKGKAWYLFDVHEAALLRPSHARYIVGIHGICTIEQCRVQTRYPLHRREPAKGIIAVTSEYEIQHRIEGSL